MDKKIEMQIRHSVLQGDSQFIRELLLTKHQISLIKLIQHLETMTTSMLSEIKGVSAQNASAKLKRLYFSGYLDRIEETAESGGFEFVYSIKLITSENKCNCRQRN
ncbi:MAG: hypothetical protein GY928_00545 [Colwellia sp.]|nr:hypothetical protein [Colwellia sp.]